MEDPQRPQTVIVQQAPKDSNPGQGLGIAGFVCSFFSILGFMAIVSFILSLIGYLQSKKAGKSNGLAVAGIAISSVGLAGNLFWLVLFMISFIASSVDSV